MMAYSTRNLFACVLFAFAGCDSSDPPADNDDGEAITHTSLFDCEAAMSCERLLLHIDEEPSSALECIVELIDNNGVGIFRELESLGGAAVDQTETFVLARGDGTGYVQARTRFCQDCDVETLPWELEEPQICSLSASEGSWHFSDCAPVEVACEDVYDTLAVDTQTCDANTCGDGEVCVVQPDQCVCNNESGEMEFVNGARGCEPALDCTDDEQRPNACYGETYCGQADAEPVYDEEGAILSCGGGPLDCFGPC